MVAAQASRLAVIEKAYETVEGVCPHGPIFASEPEVAGQPLMGDS